MEAPHYSISNTNITRLEHSDVCLRSDGIIHISIHAEQVVTTKQCEEMMDAVEALCHGKEVPIMTSIGENAVIEKEARDFSAGPRGLQFTKADAFIVKSLAHRLIANFYLKVNKPSKPSRAFSSETEAIAWLKTYL
ncbi:MAG: hypothetical protein ACJ76F_00350 [Bacteroidia bacterium]